jgi:epoxide hydrolase-like predicted phosphatase
VFRALLVDWGGVLTTSLGDTFERWADEDGIDYPHYRSLMAELLGPEAGLEAGINPIHALERGEMELSDFEALLAARLRRTDGAPVPAEGLIGRMFNRFTHAPDMNGLVRRAHASGIRTALLSNSWGNTYPRDGWSEMFDHVVISGEVGMRKPEPDIYLHTARLVGVDPGACVFVDDLAINVRAAIGLGMAGVHHVDYESTRAELEALFDIPLS